MARSVRAASAVAVAALLSTVSTFALSQSQTDYTYDVQGRLKKAERSDTSSTYSYDNAGNRTHLTVTTVNGNHPPTASNVTVPATAGGATVNIPLLTSTTDQDGDPLTLSITSQPAQGSALLAPNGLGINYTAASTVQTGAYTIGYSVSDTHATAAANITVNVTNTTTPPPTGSEILPSSFSASSSYSSFGYTGLTTANGMRDGQFFANNTIHGTNSEADAWIKADLGSIQTVGSVKLAPPDTAAAGSWGYSYLNGAEVQYSTNNASWTTVATVSGAADGAYSTVNMGGVSARYVRVHKTSNYVGLGDFMVFSGSGGNPPAGSAPVAGATYATVAYNSVSNVIALNLTGTPATSINYVTGTSHGSVEPYMGQMYYSPFAGYSGPDSFTFNASNAYGTSNTATAYLTVSAPTVTAPNANPTSTSVAANSSSNAMPLSFSGSPPTTLQVYTNPAHGTAFVSGSTIYYTPTSGYSGSDSFSYRGNNAAGWGGSAQISINVVAANAPPVANTATTDPVWQSTTGGVYPATDDTDPNGDPITITSVSGLRFAYGVINGVSLTSAPSDIGSINGFTATSVTYRAPFLSNAGTTGSNYIAVVFDYTISDGHGGSASGAHIVNVYGPQ